MAAIVQFLESTASLLNVDPATEAEGMEDIPCSPPAVGDDDGEGVSWDSLSLGPAPPTTCVLVSQGAVTPPTPRTPRALISSSTLQHPPVTGATLVIGGTGGAHSGITTMNRLPIQTSAEALRCKRKIDFAARPHPAAPAPAVGITRSRAPSSLHHRHKPQTPSVVRRNERERNRVRLVNLGFTTLREHVPAGRDNRKMSKVETLKAAVDYIRHLQELLDQEEEEEQKHNESNLHQNQHQHHQISLTLSAPSSGEYETNLSHLAAACDPSFVNTASYTTPTASALSPSGSLGSTGESDHIPSPGAYSCSSGEENLISTGRLRPISPGDGDGEPSLTQLTAWLH